MQILTEHKRSIVCTWRSVSPLMVTGFVVVDELVSVEAVELPDHPTLNFFK